jgi:hypothetical protein
MGQKVWSPETEGTMTKQNPLPEDVHTLLSLGRSVVTVFSERREELNLCRQAEALLRAGIASATYGIDRYMAVRAEAQKSPAALRFLNEARMRCERNIRQLRRRVTRSIAYLCRHMTDPELEFSS